MLLKAYQNYYQKPSRQHAIDLFDSIINYDYTIPLEELAAQRLATGIHVHFTDFYLSTNGSTGPSIRFPFGPHSKFWLTKIEDYIKYRQQNKYVLLINSLTNGSSKFSVSRRPERTSVVPAEYIIGARFDQPGAVEYLIDQLQNLGKPALFSHPNNWLYLLSKPLFRNFLKTSQLTSAMSTMWEGFFSKPPAETHFNDNMVNWFTTMNFYTCPAGTKHFLPTFVPTAQGIVNLLNLCKKPITPIDDLMVLDTEVSVCQCGKRYRHMTFIPHVQYMIRSPDGHIVYDLGLADKLKSSYINLQFIQHDQIVYILYISNDEPDIETITQFFAEHGLQGKFIRNKYFMLSAKMPVFWRCKDQPRYCLWKP